MTSHRGWQRGTRQHASAIRMVVLGIWMVIVANTPYESYARLPTDVIAGRGLGRLLFGGDALKSFFFSYPVLTTLKWSAIVGCLLAMVYPNRLRWLTPVACVCVLVLDLITKSVNGITNHAQLGPLFVLVVFALFGGRRYLPIIGLRARTDTLRMPVHWGQDPGGTIDSGYASVVWLAGLMLIIPYTYIALNRLLEGGMEVFLGNALPDSITLNSRLHAAYAFTVFLGWIQIPWLAAFLKVGFLVTTLFELCSAGVLFSQRFRVIWLAVIGSFHFITLFSMNIFFWENLMLIVVIFGWGIWNMDRTPSRITAAYT
jgi:hypothetical protein